MIELLLTICLSGSPAQCREEAIVLPPDLYPLAAVLPQQCQLASGAVLPKWTQAHPKWVVRRFKCVAPRAETRDA